MAPHFFCEQGVWVGVFAQRKSCSAEETLAASDWKAQRHGHLPLTFNCGSHFYDFAHELVPRMSPFSMVGTKRYTGANRAADCGGSDFDDRVAG
jgi:hypothetical protein